MQIHIYNFIRKYLRNQINNILLNIPYFPYILNEHDFFDTLIEHIDSYKSFYTFNLKIQIISIQRTINYLSPRYDSQTGNKVLRKEYTSHESCLENQVIDETRFTWPFTGIASLEARHRRSIVLRHQRKYQTQPRRRKNERGRGEKPSGPFLEALWVTSQGRSQVDANVSHTARPPAAVFIALFLFYFPEIYSVQTEYRVVRLPVNHLAETPRCAS